jgi:endoribonuclease LACTB2
MTFLRVQRRMATQLVNLPDVERLSPRCIRILGGNPGKFTLQGTNTYLLGTGSGRLLVDTGEGRSAWVTSLQRVLEAEKAHVSSAIITHWHHDHQGGVKHLLEISPETVIYKNQPAAGELDVTDGGKVPVSDISDGQQFQVEGASLTAIHTPGHTVDHMVFLLAEEDALFTADNVLGHGTAVFEDLGAYLASLDKMRRLFRGRAYPGHGAVIEDGPGRIAEYIGHRQQREEQVMDSLKSAPTGDSVNAEDGWTPMELVKVIYADVPEALHVPAAGNVIHILRKLEAEDKLVQRGDRWSLKGARSTL